MVKSCVLNRVLCNSNNFCFVILGVACQVSSAIVSAVSALTYQLGKQLAPIIVEQGSKVNAATI